MAGKRALLHRSVSICSGSNGGSPRARQAKRRACGPCRPTSPRLDPLDFAGAIGEDGILIGSPPCPTYSAAGNGAGKHDLQHVIACTRELAEGSDTRVDHLARCEDGRSLLVVEPLRWALALRPRAVVLEQVPSVLPYWRIVGEALGALGYSWWAGKLEAERFGVPQTRERAILIARRDGVAAHPPEPTHHRYMPNEPRPEASEGLFGGLLPWVSMEEALGWANGQENAATRGTGEPAPTITADGHDTANRVWTMATNHDRPARKEAGAGNRPRPADEPAATIDTTTRQASWAWAQRPAPTVTGGGTASGGAEPFSSSRASLERMREDWYRERPATTVNGDPRISAPGRHDPERSGSQQEGAIRVTVEEAAILQSFPLEWPFQGSRTAQFTQVGNAVPPLLGEAILRTLIV